MNLYFDIGLVLEVLKIQLAYINEAKTNGSFNATFEHNVWHEAGTTFGLATKTYIAHAKNVLNP